MRQTLSSAGAVLGTTQYDPWGVVQSGTSAPFGFAGEVQDGNLVNLRARWYNATNGTFTAQRWRTSESSDTMPYSHHVYAYALGNPVSFTDPTGKYACDVVPGGYAYESAFCVEQKKRLDTQFDIDNPNSVIKTKPLATLIDLFRDPNLPGGSSKEAESNRSRFLTPAAERLQFVLWYTRGEGRFSHNRLLFSDYDFAREFRDGDRWANADGTFIVSNQVNHFLTAVDLAYRSDWLTEGVAAHCLVGHEKYGQGAKPEWYQCTVGVSSKEVYKFRKAVSADAIEDDQLRDCLIAELLPDLPEIEFRGLATNDPRLGNSRQDLRLSIKGWRFGLLIKEGTISTLNEASNWLAQNLSE